MVAIMKPKARERVSDSEFLQRVRALIDSGDERFICNAIEHVGRRFGTPAQIATLVLKVRQVIYPYAYYTQWAVTAQPDIVEIGPGWQRRGRLELIDRFIQEAQHGKT